MSSKIATIGALSAGGITVGAVATVSVMLLTGGSAFSEMSDMDALEHGFTQMFESEETCKYLEMLENLEGKPISSYYDVSINNIYELDELLGVNFGFTLDTDAEDLLFTIYGDSPELPFKEALSGSFYLSPEMMAFTSNAISQYITVNFDSFVEDYNDSYLATLTGPIDMSQFESSMDMDSEAITEAVTEIMEGISAIDTEELEKNLKAQLDEDIEILMNNVKTSRSDEVTDVNGFEAYKMTVSVDASYVLKIAYNQIIEFFADKSVQAYITDMYDNFAFDFGGEDKDLANEISAALTLAYGTIEEEFKDTFGEKIKLNVYFTEEADIRRIELPISFTQTYQDEDLGETKDTQNMSLAVNFYGEDDIYSEYALIYETEIIDSDETGTIEYSKRFKDDSTVYLFRIAENTDDVVAISLTNTTTDDTFKNLIRVAADGVELITANINGTYKLTDNSIDVNASKITIDAAGLPILDMTTKFGFSENKDDVTFPSDKSIKLTDMTLDDLVNIAEEFGTFMGMPGLGESLKDSIEGMDIEDLDDESLYTIDEIDE